ncbi:MAG: EMC3/TMCO1 family protein [archaeon]
MLEKVLDPIFNPLLGLGYFWFILIVAFILTLIITLIYKFTTDQTLMKKLKAEMKTLQKEMKSVANNPQKAMAHQKKLMSKNMDYMKHSLKPTLYTFIPIIIIFGWLNSHLAYLPLEPGNEFLVSAEFKKGTFGEVSLDVIPELDMLSERTQTIQDNYAAWTLNGEQGDYQMSITFGNRQFEKDLSISDNSYATPLMTIKDSDFIKLEIHNEKVKPLGNFSLFGWKPGWLGTYIILSLIFSLGMRKLLKIS